MRVFKFGGASVKNATAVKNVAAILKRYPDEDIVMVLSAMGKTTNGLEKVVKSYFFNDGQAELHLNIIKEYHYALAEELFAERKELVFNALKELFSNLENYINEPHGDY